MNNKNRLALITASLVMVAIAIGWIVFRGGRLESELDHTEDETLTEELFAMDTVMDITLYRTEQTDRPLRDIFIEMRDRIYQMEEERSVTKVSSDVARINAAGGQAVEVSEDTGELLGQALQVAGETDGVFDPTIYPIVKLWGFTTGEYRVPSQEAIAKTLSTVDYRKVELWQRAVGRDEGERRGLFRRYCGSEGRTVTCRGDPQ